MVVRALFRSDYFPEININIRDDFSGSDRGEVTGIQIFFFTEFLPTLKLPVELSNLILVKF